MEVCKKGEFLMSKLVLKKLDTVPLLSHVLGVA